VSECFDNRGIGLGQHGPLFHSSRWRSQVPANPQIVGHQQPMTYQEFYDGRDAGYTQRRVYRIPGAFRTGVRRSAGYLALLPPLMTSPTRSMPWCKKTPHHISCSFIAPHDMHHLHCWVLSHGMMTIFLVSKGTCTLATKSTPSSGPSPLSLARCLRRSQFWATWMAAAWATAIGDNVLGP
jgi:hypothetical protein